MDLSSNPFRPGAGFKPPLLAGRERDLLEFDAMCDRCENYGEGARPWVLQGLRGVGKTALLSEFVARADQRKWITCRVEASSERALGMLIARGLYRSLRYVIGRRPEGLLRELVAVFKGFSLAVDPSGTYRFGIDVDASSLTGSDDLSHDLTVLFETLGEVARSRGIGVLLVVDEMQQANDSELTALNIATHAACQAPVPIPILVIGAGLPSLPAVLADATSYAERLYEYRRVGLLDMDATRDALAVPVRERGADWSQEALEYTIARAGGYPHFIQACGRRIWDYATASPISLEDAEVGWLAARAEFDEGLYLSRWDRATRSQRNLLRGMAEFGEGASVPVAELPAKVGKRRLSDISNARTDLIKKGLIFVPERGALKFTVPGMADFIFRQPGAEG